jgi:uncharacterized membrane protein
LSAESAAQVRAEIEEHYRAAIASGATDEEAVMALGDPAVANRQYRLVLLTTAEAKHLRAAVRETRAVCARRGLRSIFIATPFLSVSFAAVYFPHSHVVAKAALLMGVLLGVGLAAPFLPIYTPMRSRIYRAVKWTVLFALPAWLGGSKFAALLPSILFYLIYLEFVSASIRRKLPVEQWPKALYL